MFTDRVRALAARSHPRRQPRERLLAALVSLLAGVAVYAVATGVFPHHSLNHDEGVYLQQAAMLLDGQLAMHAGELADAVRPWFFVRDGGRLYPKYQPYPAALYAVAMATVGEPRVALAAVAAGNAALTYALAATAFDRRVGVVAAAAFAAAPMTLVTTATFLPYAPTTLLNLAFALLYLRALERGGVRTAALAGAAVGLAAFARPYTALLFAAPFVAHAGWQVLAAARRQGLRPLPEPLRRNLATAAVALAFVALALAYNARLTGSPLQFPFQAFAPRDGPGFGTRQILDYTLEYTPGLALNANAHVLWYLLTRWGPAGPVGSLLALAGLGHTVRHRRQRGWRAPLRAASDGSRTARLLLAALFVSVPLGNLAFWGNFNVLGPSFAPTDGLLAVVGPVYHFDLLAPLSVFAAAGLVGAWRAARDWSPGDAAAIERRLRLDSLDGQRARALLLAAVVATGLLAGAATAALAATPLERNAAHTEALDRAYEPLEERAFDDAVVFVPTPYGPWLNHPFQKLRNDPGLDGPIVYAMDRAPAGDFEVLDAYPERTVYRYTYRGEWPPPPDEHVEPKLERLSVRSGEEATGETTVSVPDGVEHATVRLRTGPDDAATAVVREPGEELTVGWSIDPDGARLTGPAAHDAGRLPIEDAEEVLLLVRLTDSEGSTLTYRQETTVRTTADGVELLWPPERTVCPLVDDCGRSGTYLPGEPAAGYEDVRFETELSDGASQRSGG